MTIQRMLMLGVCLCASVYSDGYLNQQEGEKMLLKAISLSPSTANYHSNLGMVMCALACFALAEFYQISSFNSVIC